MTPEIAERPPVADRSQQKRLAVDIGGTFTDIVVEAGDKRWTRKLLTTPQAPEQAVIAGTLELLGEIGIAAGEIGLFLHGTTLATNAIIERKGAVTALIATEGFRDILDIADEGRYDQYDIFIEKPKALVPRFRRFTVPERIDAAGKVLKPLDEAAVLALLPRARPPRHRERRGRLPPQLCRCRAMSAGSARSWRRRAPGLAVTLSSEVCPEMREYERISTAVANAYVQPMMAGYLGRLGEALTAKGFRCPVYLMTSGGGLTTLETARRFPIRLVESGPAGGAILASFVAAECGGEQGALLRHGRHHRQDLPDRESEAADLAQLRGRPRRAVPPGQRPAFAHPRDRDGGDRRRRRLARPCRRHGPHHRRARERRAPSRAPPATAAAAPIRR